MTMIHLHWHDTCHISAKQHRGERDFATLKLTLDQSTEVNLFADSLSQLASLLNIAQIQIANAMNPAPAETNPDADCGGV